MGFGFGFGLLALLAILFGLLFEGGLFGGGDEENSL